VFRCLLIDHLSCYPIIGQLTEAVRRKPYGATFVFAEPRLHLITSLAVILLDELEKAHKVAKYLSAPGDWLMHVGCHHDTASNFGRRHHHRQPGSKS
jgi:hypothetical protein